jgi:hypothetical protein
MKVSLYTNFIPSHKISKGRGTLGGVQRKLINRWQTGLEVADLMYYMIINSSQVVSSKGMGGLGEEGAQLQFCLPDKTHFFWPKYNLQQILGLSYSQL